ncbi:hypothetical protein Rsub_02679 [Raphidocelis subcapitata]|uniref:RING-type domain-containing protein n=1 Tax=Raphidocelis subcapitata TaxID=307507 RepID=A0A2V0NWN2_9CHLO|nr:hypothetical protein Rsub_02679 [Raphidocelis subcapitata]|eukprot:GBF89973.1 hypothetical protein Rsub_02679 [Raphidocelis subcapitata]
MASGISFQPDCSASDCSDGAMGPRVCVDELTPHLCCSLCNDLAAGALVLACGHLFCGACLSDRLICSPKCPACHMALRAIPIRCRAVDHVIDALLPALSEARRDAFRRRREGGEGAASMVAKMLWHLEAGAAGRRRGAEPRGGAAPRLGAARDAGPITLPAGAAGGAAASAPPFNLPMQLGGLSLGTAGLAFSGPGGAGPGVMGLGAAGLDAGAGLAPPSGLQLQAAALQQGLQWGAVAPIGGGAPVLLQPPGLVDPQLQPQLHLQGAAAGGGYGPSPAAAPLPQYRAAPAQLWLPGPGAVLHPQLGVGLIM